MKVYTINEFGITTPFDLNAYAEEIKSQTYIETRRAQRKKAHEKKAEKKMAHIRITFGIIMIIASCIMCKLMIAMGEHDMTYMVFLLPMAIALIFGKD